MPPEAAAPRDETLGYLLGLLAVAAFALTLPTTRHAVRFFDPVFVGLGRAVGAALLAAIYLLASGARRPSRAQLGQLGIIAGGVVVGFPLLSAWAMRFVDASHGGVVLGILPLATALAGAWMAGERLPARFWAVAAAGTALVTGFALSHSHGALAPADLALLGAVAAAAIGYAAGARLARSLGGLAVISWALLLSAPFLIGPVALHAPATLAAPASAWLAFAYVMVVSQFLGFLAWYRGLALGGIARVGQTQLLQPILTILASGVLLGEPGDAATWLVAGLVLALVAVGRRVSR